MGNKPNPFLAKQEQKQQMCFEAGCSTTAQQFFDYLCIVLNDPNVMGKDVFGANRIKKVHEALKATDKYYSEAFEIDLPADIGTDAYTDVTESYHNGDPGILA